MTIFLSLFLILLTVVLNTCAQILLKFGAGKSIFNIYLLGGIVTYAISTIVYILVLSKLQLSVTYPVVIGLTVAATTCLGAVILKEQVPFIHWLGIGLMLSGISAIVFGKIS
jgi:multidrug transporter EmrE-like cation transporter